jgi:hypothetical protein
MDRLLQLGMESLCIHYDALMSSVKEISGCVELRLTKDGLASHW